MSLEKPSLSGSPATDTNQTDPATILSDFWQEEEEDWATELLRAVNPSGQPSPDSEENTANTPPDKPRDITQIIEFKVPVSNEIQPQGVISVENLWTSNFSSEPSTSLQVVETRVPPSLPAEHLVILPRSPPQEQAGHSTPPHPPARQFLASSPGMDFLPTTVSTPPMSPETRFLEKHNIMKWVIDDQDEGDIPGLSAGISCPTEPQLTAPVTSQPTPSPAAPSCQSEEEDRAPTLRAR